MAYYKGALRVPLSGFFLGRREATCRSGSFTLNKSKLSICIFPFVQMTTEHVMLLLPK